MNSICIHSASLLPIAQPIGCFLGGFFQNFIGRKHGLLVMNISTIMSWTVLYEATSVEMLYLSSILAGISIGLIEAPGVTYLCEITTPELRGTLVMVQQTNVTIGALLPFLLSTFLSWRISCLIYVSWSVFSILLLIFVSV